MRLLRRLVGMLFVSAILTACGSPQQSEGTVPIPTPEGSSSSPVVIGDRSPVIWNLREEPAPEATELDVILEERACSGGRKLTSKNIRLDIGYSDEAITIAVSADPLEEDHFYTCELARNPYTIELEEPAGGRELLDGSVYPPERRD